MAKNEENWYANYEELKAHVLETGHFFPKHNRLCNLAKYQRKRLKARLMKAPAFKMILTATGEYAYRRSEDGIYIVPIGCLKP